LALTVAAAGTEAERLAVYRFRYRVYAEEMGLSPPEADHQARVLSDPLDGPGISFALLDDGEVVGSLRLVYLEDLDDPGPLLQKFHLQPAIDELGSKAVCTTSRFMLDPRLRHGRAILQLMEAAYIHGVDRGVRLNYGDCSPHLVPFYEHLGYRRYARAYNDSSYGFKVPILMLARDQQGLERLRSPLARVAARYPDDPEAREWFARNYPEYLGIESAVFLPEGAFFDLLAGRVANDPLHSISLLRGLERDEAERFMSRANVVQASPGDRIVRQGERGSALYVLLSGLAEVLLDERPDVPVAVLGAGDPFAEISFVTGEPCTANVVAKTASEVLVISNEYLQWFTGKEPAIAAKLTLNLARVLAERLASTTRLLAAP
jgi:cyclic nucleotide-binding protein/N-acyl amino acid synthase FeeM